MALVSRNEYAALKGVSHTAINKAVNKGEIPLVDGKIDAEAPNAWEERRREIAKRRRERTREERLDPQRPPSLRAGAGCRRRRR